MKNTMWKTTLREIRQSLGRYLAVLAIIALGVGLFSGLMLTNPFMVDTANQYLKEKGFFDFRLLSTYGFEQVDVDYLSKKDEAAVVEGAYSYDVLTYYAPTEATLVLKMHSLMEQINQLELTAGRFPEQENECVVDSRLFGESALGKVLQITEQNEEDTLDVLVTKEYKIVGVVKSSYYIQFERGNTSVGNGKIDGFMYVQPESFDSEIFTEVFVKLNHDLDIYSEAYDAFVEEQEPIWEAYLNEAGTLRYERAKTTALQELADAKEEFAAQKADGEAELADAKQKLDDAKLEIEHAKQELADGKQQIEDGKKELADGKQGLIDGKQQIEDGKAEIADGEKEMKAGYAEIAENKKKLEAGEAEFKKNQAAFAEKEAQFQEILETWEKNKAEIDAGMQHVAEKEAEVRAYQADLSAKETELYDLEKAMRNGEVSSEQFMQTLARINALRVELVDLEAHIRLTKTEITITHTQLESAQAQLDAAKPQIDEGKVQFAEAKAQLAAAEKEIADGKRQITEGEAALKKAEKDLEQAKADIAQAELDLVQAEKDIAQAETELAEAELELAEGEKELAQGEAEYVDGLKEYEDGLRTFEQEIADAEEEIADAEKMIHDMEPTDCYMLGRSTNVGYVCLENDSQIVTDVAKVFPVFFFLIAALVCMTTMNRMVEEQRTQIGILKALGYKNSTIMGKYLFYSGSAAGVGCIVGYLFGMYCITSVIWMAYSMMYDMGGLSYSVDWGLFAVSMFVSLLCSMGVTWFSCHNELFNVAAVLMRPKAPKSGKRVFLERIPFIWNRLSFLVKVSIRNVFRYKKRFFMMIVGISGCMALLLTGFGIQDSIVDITSMQYGEILLYDMSLSLKEEADTKLREEIADITEGKADAVDYFMETSLDLTANDNRKSVYLIVPENLENFEKYINLHTLDGEPVAYPKTGEAVLTHKMATNFGIEIGDTVQLTDEDHNVFEVTVSGICKNFISSYIFMNAETCTERWKAPEYKTAYINVPEENEEMYELSTELMKLENTTNIVITKDSEQRFDAMMSSLDYVIVVIIGCAAALAFIVLYNLTNINITERIREIATIKVLGFYKNETATYVFRENVALTAIGAFVGLFVGKVFHAFVMSCINIDLVAFDVRIRPISYVYSVALTFVFAWVVNWFMSGKLEKISMTESLKSVD